MTTLQMAALAAAGLAAVLWLVISFSSPGPRRAVWEWLATLALYGALICFFANLSLTAWEEGRRVAPFAFGALAAFFTGGAGVAIFRLVAAARGRSAQDVNVTH